MAALLSSPATTTVLGGCVCVCVSALRGRSQCMSITGFPSSLEENKLLLFICVMNSLWRRTSESGLIQWNPRPGWRQVVPSRQRWLTLTSNLTSNFQTHPVEQMKDPLRNILSLSLSFFPASFCSDPRGVTCVRQLASAGHNDVRVFKDLKSSLRDIYIGKRSQQPE